VDDADLDATRRKISGPIESIESVRSRVRKEIVADRPQKYDFAPKMFKNQAKFEHSEKL
jgi:hypothetical protein